MQEKYKEEIYWDIFVWNFFYIFKILIELGTTCKKKALEINFMLLIWYNW